jgi:hypothetical protein
MIIAPGMDVKQGVGVMRLFPMVQSSDHITPFTGGSPGFVAAPVVKISKNGNAGVTATNSPALEIDRTNLPGIWGIAWASTDLSILGDLAVASTATAADPTTWTDHVRAQLFTDAALVGTGAGTAPTRVASNVQQNTNITVMFTMTSTATGAPLTGLAGFSCQRSFGAGFTPCANLPTEVGGGNYALVLNAADTNSAVVLVRITQSLCNDNNIVLYTSP